MKPSTQMFMYFLAYFVLFGTWAAIIFTSNAKAIGAESLVQYIQLTLASLTGHVLTMIQPSPPDAAQPPVNAQAGKSDPFLLMILAGMAALAVAGCASTQQVIGGYEAAAVKSIKMAEDNNIQFWTTNVCGTPYSAVLRHPEIIPAMKALCLPGGTASDPSTLFDFTAPLKPSK